MVGVVGKRVVMRSPCAGVVPNKVSLPSSLSLSLALPMSRLPVCVLVCVFITAEPITMINLFEWGEGIVYFSGHQAKPLTGLAKRAVYLLVCVFITAVPNTKLCAWGEEDSGGHVL